VGPTWVHGVGKVMLGDKNIIYSVETLPKMRFYGRSNFFLSSYNLTGGSGVSGKASPNWMRKVSNCFRSL
jgi:hypothetical protein